MSAEKPLPEVVSLNGVAYWTIRNAKCNQSIIRDVESVARYVYVQYRERMYVYRTKDTVYFYLTTSEPVMVALMMMRDISKKLHFGWVK